MEYGVQDLEIVDKNMLFLLFMTTVGVASMLEIELHKDFEACKVKFGQEMDLKGVDRDDATDKVLEILALQARERPT